MEHWDEFQEHSSIFNMCLIVHVSPRDVWTAFEVLKVTDSSVITGFRLGSSKWLRNRAIPPLSSGTFLSCNKKCSMRLQQRQLDEH